MSAGKVVLVVLAAAAAWGVVSGGKMAGGEPVAHQVAVESLSCRKRMEGITILSLTVRNTGSAPIPYGTAYVRIGTDVVDAHFRPSPIPAGGLAEAGGYMRAEGDCTLVEIQAGDGAPVTVR